MRGAQREVLWNLSSIDRVRKCGRVPVEEADVTIRDNGGVAHYSGLTTCGNIHACPVCSGKIRNRRAEEIAETAALWIAAGGAVYAAAFTMPHDYGDRLDATFDTVARGFRSVISGRRWKRDKEAAGVIGQDRAIETTYGDNGWHPHAHVLFYTESELNADQLAQLITGLRDRWRSFITKRGYRPPSDRRGVQVEKVNRGKDAGAYIAKTQDGQSIGNELARGDLKSGKEGRRTPFEILEDFRWTGDKKDLALWYEYERATRGRRVIQRCSPVRDRLGRSLSKKSQEQEDHDDAAEEIGGDVIALVPRGMWREITRIPGLPAAVLDAAEAGGFSSINGRLRRYGLAVHAPDADRSSPL